MIPREAIEFLRREWRAAILFLVAVEVLVGSGILANQATTPMVRMAAALASCAAFGFILSQSKYRRWILYVTVEQWRAIDRETQREPGEAGTYHWRILIVLVTVAVSLTIQEYIGDRGFYEKMFPPHGRVDSYWELRGFAWWSGWRVLGYAVMPMIVLFAFRQPIREYHLSPRGFLRHLWIYILLFLFVSQVVLYASTTAGFRHTYPFYRMANRSNFDLWAWEGLYAAQFVALEVFFRGFILHGLRRALGSNAIFVMIVPYCMIHFGKPMPETLGAIVAGLILGTLAMRTKSIWGGVLIHIGVAMTMDVLALRGCPPLGSGHWCGD